MVIYMGLRKKIFSASLILAGIITLSSCTYIDSLKKIMNGKEESSETESSQKNSSNIES